MNYADCMIMPLFINSNFSITLGKKIDREAKYLIEDARQAIASAREENKYGNIANSLAVEEEKSNIAERHNLAVIALWHYQRGIEKYREAIKYLKIAAAHDLPEKYEKYVGLQIRESEKYLNITSERKCSIENLQVSAQ